MPERLQMLSDNIDSQISFYEDNYGVEATKNILSGYIQDVVTPMKYSSEVENLILLKVQSYGSEKNGVK